VSEAIDIKVKRRNMKKNTAKNEKYEELWIASQFLAIVSLPLFYYLIGPFLASLTQTGREFSTLGAVCLGGVAIVSAFLSLKYLAGKYKLFASLGFVSALIYFFYAWLASTFLLGLGY